jgi:KDO2-lipid IV(A) lauroyltransferase
MSRLLYHLFIYPLSKLPLPVLYVFSDLLYLLLFRLLGYRRKVVKTNLKNAFPEKSKREIAAIAHAFYRHFGDLVVESVKIFSISREEALRRCRVRNPELMEAYYAQSRSVILISGHYNNWELAAMTVDLQIPHQTAGIYAPLSNAFFNEKLKASRMRFGLELVSLSEVTKAMQDNQNRLTSTLFATDQSPTFSKNVYWTRFLNQDTAVFFGAEKFAREYNYPAVYGKIAKVRRGYYEVTFEIVEDQPRMAPQGAITEKHTRLLEKQILEKPQYWLWSHKRWKRKRDSSSSGN